MCVGVWYKGEHIQCTVRLAEVFKNVVPPPYDQEESCLCVVENLQHKLLCTQKWVRYDYIDYEVRDELEEDAKTMIGVEMIQQQLRDAQMKPQDVEPGTVVLASCNAPWSSWRRCLPGDSTPWEIWDDSEEEWHATEAWPLKVMAAPPLLEAQLHLDLKRTEK